LLSFASGGSVRRGWLESWPTRTGTALLVVCLSLGWCREVRVWCVPFTLVRGVSVSTKIWYWKETNLWAEFGKETPFGRKFSSKHSVKEPAVGSMPSFGRRVALCLEKETFGNT
jgi:hypothetical protein